MSLEIIHQFLLVRCQFGAGELTNASKRFLVFLVGDPFKGIIWSQIILSIQLPLTIFSLLFLTSSRKVMRQFANSTRDNILLWCTGAIVVVLNVMLLLQYL